MNVDVYIFGEFNNGYSQYPDDYTRTIFEKFYINSESISQIGIHREGNLMYYGYIEKLELSNYIGFCAVINGTMFTKLDKLFNPFEDAISDLVKNGLLKRLNENDTIVTNIEKLNLSREKINLITESLTAGFNKFQKNTKPLPAINYSVSKDSIKRFSLDDNLNDIIDASHTYGYTFFYKSKQSNKNNSNDFKETIESLNNEKIELANQLKELNSEYQKIINKKKQYLFVAVLSFLLLGSLAGLLGFNKNLKQANAIIIQQDATLKDNNIEIQSLKKKTKDLENQINNNNIIIKSLSDKNIDLHKNINLRSN